MNDYKFHFIDNVLFIEFNVPVEEDSIKNAIEDVQATFSNIIFRVVAIKNIIGYWSAKDILKNKSIYCGTMSIKDTKRNIKEYLTIN